MSGDGFRELLRSPLDDLPEPGDRRLQLLALVGAVVGATLTAALVWALGGFDDPEPVAVSTTIASTTTTVAPASRIVLEPQWLLEIEGLMYVAVAEVAAAGADPGPGMLSANWSAELGDGSTLPAVAESLDGRVPGLFVASFPAAPIDDVVAVVARPLSGTEEVTATTELYAAQFPLVLNPPDLNAGETSLVVDEAVLHGAGGEVSWRLRGPPEERATLVVAADYRRAGADRDEAIRTEFLIPGVALQLGQDEDEPSRGGTIDLFHLDDPEEPTYRTRFWGDARKEFDVESVTVTWTMTVYRYESNEIRVPVPPAR